MTGAFCADDAHVDTWAQWPVGSRWKAPSNGIAMSNTRHTSIAVMAGRLRKALFIRGQCNPGGPSRLPIDPAAPMIFSPGIAGGLGCQGQLPEGGGRRSSRSARCRASSGERREGPRGVSDHHGGPPAGVSPPRGPEASHADRARPDENLELSSVRDPDHHETAHAPVRGAAPWSRTADAPMACSVFSPSFEVRSVPRYRLTF